MSHKKDLARSRRSRVLTLDDLDTPFPRDTSLSFMIEFENGTRSSGKTNLREEEFRAYYPPGTPVLRAYYGRPPDAPTLRIKRVAFWH